MGELIDKESLQLNMLENYKKFQTILDYSLIYRIIDKETPVDAIPTDKIKNMIAEIDDYLHKSGVSLSVRANVFKIADRYSEGGKKV